MIIIIYILIILLITIILVLPDFYVINFSLVWFTKLYYNNLFIILILSLILSFFFNINNYFLLIFNCFLFKIPTIFNTPLSNILFSIHPTIIYFCLIFSLVLLYKNIKFSFFKKNIFFLNLSMFLGGVWSLQEFNWGGWWNWDLVEVYILIIVYFYIFFTHNSKKTIKILISYYIIWFFLIIYYIICNKLGINVSIHSFIKSKFYLNYYYLIILLIYILIFFYNFKYTIYLLILLIYINNSINSLFFLKNLLIGLIYYKPTNITKYTFKIHKIINKIYLILYLFNFKNKTYYTNFNIPKIYVFFIIFKNKFILKINLNITYFNIVKTNFLWYKLSNFFFKFIIFFTKLGYSGFFFSFFF